MGFVAAFVALIGLIVSIFLFLISSKIVKSRGKTHALKMKGISFILWIVLTVLVVYTGFSLFSSMPHSGAPTAEDYEILLIKGGVVGLSPGIGRLLSVFLQPVILKFLSKDGKR